jgi:hypothetical protein
VNDQSPKDPDPRDEEALGSYRRIRFTARSLFIRDTKLAKLALTDASEKELEEIIFGIQMQFTEAYRNGDILDEEKSGLAEPKNKKQDDDQPPDPAQPQIKWPAGCNESGNPRGEYTNVITALKQPKLKIEFYYDRLHYRHMAVSPELATVKPSPRGRPTDAAERYPRELIANQSRLFAAKETISEAARRLAEEQERHEFDELLKTLKWDGVVRLPIHGR